MVEDEITINEIDLDELKSIVEELKNNISPIRKRIRLQWRKHYPSAYKIDNIDLLSNLDHINASINAILKYTNELELHIMAQLVKRQAVLGG